MNFGAKQNLKIKKGEVILLTTGEYSDYGIRGQLVFIKDCNLKAYVKSKVDGKEQYTADCPEPEHIPSNLVADGYALPLEYREIHLGDYGNFHEDFEVEYKND